MTKLARILGVAALGALFGTLGTAQTTGSEGAELGEPDTTFLAEAVVGSLGEIHVSEAALAKLSQEPVKDLANRLIKDHSELAERLTALAEEHKIAEEGTKGTQPLEVPEEAAQKAEEFTGLSGEEADANYLEFMIEQHRAGIKLYKDEAENGTDEELQQLASETVPVLEEHLRLAESLHEQ